MKKSRRVTIRMTSAAEADLEHILRWTTNRFGKVQARAYARTVYAAIESLADRGAAQSGVKVRNEIGPGLFTLHVARQGRKGRHFLLLRIATGEPLRHVVEILRVLHDAMDLPQHVPED